MNRQDIERDLPLYLDGELPPSRAAEVEAALADDAALRALADEYRAVDVLLDEHPEVAPTPGFAARVAASVQAEEAKAVSAAPRSSPFASWRVAASVLAAGLLVTVTLVITRRDTDPTAPPPPPTVGPAAIYGPEYAAHVPEPKRVEVDPGVAEDVETIFDNERNFGL